MATSLSELGRLIAEQQRRQREQQEQLASSAPPVTTLPAGLTAPAMNPVPGAPPTTQGVPPTTQAPPMNLNRVREDLARQFRAGVGDIGAAASELIAASPIGLALRGYEQLLGRDLPVPGTAAGGQRMRDYARGMAGEVSPQGQAQMRAISEADWTDIPGQVARNPYGLGLVLARSAPSFAAGLPHIRPIMAAAATNAMMRGATPAVAQRMAELAGRRASVVTSGGMGAGFAASETQERIRAMPEETLRQNEDYLQLLREGATPAEAREELARSSALAAMAVAGPISGIAGAFGAPFETRLVGRGLTAGLGSRGGAAAQGALREAVEGGIQEPAEALGQNVGVRMLDPQQELTEGLAEAATLGAITEGAMGAGVGAFAGGQPEAPLAPELRPPGAPPGQGLTPYGGPPDQPGATVGGPQVFSPQRRGAAPPPAEGELIRAGVLPPPGGGLAALPLGGPLPALPPPGGDLSPLQRGLSNVIQSQQERATRRELRHTERQAGREMQLDEQRLRSTQESAAIPEQYQRQPEPEPVLAPEATPPAAFQPELELTGQPMPPTQGALFEQLPLPTGVSPYGETTLEPEQAGLEGRPEAGIPQDREVGAGGQVPEGGGGRRLRDGEGGPPGAEGGLPPSEAEAEEIAVTGPPRRKETELRAQLDELTPEQRKHAIEIIRFQSYGDEERQQLYDELRADGVSPEKAEALTDKIVHRFKDDKTGFEGDLARLETIDKAKDYLQANPDMTAYYVEADVMNLGGLNNTLTNLGADTPLVAMSRFFGDQMRALPGEVTLYRQGGDEFGAIIVGPKAQLTPELVGQALGQAQANVRAYAEQNTVGDLTLDPDIKAEMGGTLLSDIDHPKHKGSPAHKGTGLTLGVATVNPQLSRDRIIGDAGAQVERNKATGIAAKMPPYVDPLFPPALTSEELTRVERETTETPGAGPEVSGRPARPVEGAGPLGAQAATGRAPSRQRVTASVNTQRDSLAVAIAKLGGLDRAAAESEGFDPALTRSRRKDNRPAGASMPLFRATGGRTFDDLATVLNEFGYFADRPVTANELVDMVDQEVRGNKIFATDEAREVEAQKAEPEREQEAAQAQEEDVFADAEFTLDENLEIGYFDLDGTEQQIEELSSTLMELEGVDSATDIIERLAIEHENNYGGFLFGLDQAVQSARRRREGGRGPIGEDLETTGQERAESGAQAQAAGRPEAPAEPFELTTQTEQDLEASVRAEADRAEGERQLQQRAEADRQLAEFELTGSTRPADQAPGRQVDLEDIIRRNRQIEEDTLQYTRDLLGYHGDIEEAEGVYRVEEGRDSTGAPRPASAKNPKSGQLDLFYDQDLATPDISQEPELYTRTKLVTTGHFNVPQETANTPEEVAAAMLALHKQPQEQLMMVVTGQGGKLLGVIRHTIGTVDQAPVAPATFIGAALRVPGAANLWAVHNHPSGEPRQSQADVMISGRIAETLRESGITYQGSVVIGGENRASYVYPPPPGSLEASGGAREFTIEQPDLSEGLQIPRLEREFQKFGAAQQTPIEGVSRAKAAIITLAQGREGIMVMDTKHRPTGFIPMPSEQMERLRRGDPKTGAPKLLRLLEESNAAAVIFRVDTPLEADRDAHDNLWNFLDKYARVRLLDAFTGPPVDSLSTAERNESPYTGEFYSRGGNRDGLSPDAFRAELVEQLGEKTVAALEARGVRFVETVADLPPRADGIAHPDDAQAVAYPGTGQLYFVTENVNSGDAKGLLLHEIGTHEGLRSLLGDAWQQVLTDVEVALFNQSAPFQQARARAERSVEAANVPDPERAAQMLTEETIAYLVQYNSDLPFTRRVLARLRNALRETGLVMTVNQADLTEMAIAALRQQVAVDTGSERISTPYTTGRARPYKAGGPPPDEPRENPSAESLATRRGGELRYARADRPNQPPDPTLPVYQYRQYPLHANVARPGYELSFAEIPATGTTGRRIEATTGGGVRLTAEEIDPWETTGGAPEWLLYSNGELLKLRLPNPIRSQEDAKLSLNRVAAQLDYQPRERGPMWYSQGARWAGEKIGRKGLKPEELRKQLNAAARKGEIKAEELYWSGVEEWLDSLDPNERLSSAKVARFFTDQAPPLKEIVRSGQAGDVKRGADEILTYQIQEGIPAAPSVLAAQSESGDKIVLTRQANSSAFDIHINGNYAGHGKDREDAQNKAARYISKTDPRMTLDWQPGSENQFIAISPINGDRFELWGTSSSFPTPHAEWTLTYPHPTQGSVTVPVTSIEHGQDIAQNKVKNQPDIWLDPQHEQYTVPGDWDNYREFVISMPDLTAVDQAFYAESHFPDANPIVHVRTTDRYGGEGLDSATYRMVDEVLFIEEIQSDLHQAARERGYRPTEAEYDQVTWDNVREGLELLGEGDAYADLESSTNLYEDLVKVFTTVYKKRASIEPLAPGIAVDLRKSSDPDVRRGALLISKAINRVNTRESALQQGVPDAPFKKNAWAEFAIKRMLREAIEHDYDYIVWANGDQNYAHYKGGEDQLNGMRFFYSQGGQLEKAANKVLRSLGVKQKVEVVDVDAKQPAAPGLEIIYDEFGNPLEDHLGNWTLDELIQHGPEEWMQEDAQRLLDMWDELTQEANEFELKDAARSYSVNLLWDYADYLPRVQARNEIEEALSKLENDINAHMSERERKQTEYDKGNRVNVGIRITPELKASLLQGQPFYARRDPPNESPELKAAKAKVGIDERPTHQRVADGVRSLFTSNQSIDDADRVNKGDTVQQALFNKYHGMWAAERKMHGDVLTELGASASGAVAARMSTGVPAVMKGILGYGAPRWENGMLQKIPGSEGLMDIWSDVYKRGELNDYFYWRVGRRALNLNAEKEWLKDSQGRRTIPPSGFTRQEAEALIKLAGKPGGEKAKRFRKTSNKEAKLRRAILDVAIGGGVLDPAAVELWNFIDYIPFYRVGDEVGDDARMLGPRLIGQLQGQSSGIRRFIGSSRAVNDPMENIIQNFTRLIDSSMKNYAVLTTIKNVMPSVNQKTPGYQPVTEVTHLERFKPAVVPLDQIRTMLKKQGVDPARLPEDALRGMAKLWSYQVPTGPDVIRVMDGGKPRYFHVHDPLLLRSLTAVRHSPMDQYMKPFRFFKRLLTAGVTSTPEFAAANGMRDAVMTWVISPQRQRFLLDFMQGAVEYYREGEIFENMMFSGASFEGGYYNGTDPNAIRNAIRREMRRKGYGGAAIDGHMRWVMDTPARWWAAYRRVLDAVENGSRAAVYKSVMRSGAGDPDVKARALFEAKDVMDYSMQGDHQIMKLFGDTVAFFNARVVGMYKLGRSGAIPFPGLPWRPEVLARGSMITLFSVGLYALARAMQPEEHDDLPEWMRDNYWNFPVKNLDMKDPVTGEVVNWMHVPKPFEVGVIWGSIPERIWANQLAMGDETHQRTALTIADMFVNTLSMNPIPTALQPWSEVWFNRSSFTGRPIEGIAIQGRRPAERYNLGTSPIFVALGQYGPQDPKIPLRLSPTQMQHLYEGYLGTMGTYSLMVADAVTRAAYGMPSRPRRVDEYPLARRLMSLDPPRYTQMMTEVYDLDQKISEMARSLNFHQQYRQGEQAAEILFENRDLLQLKPVLDDVTNRFRKSRKQEDAIIMNPNLTERQRLEELNNLRRGRAEDAREVMQKYRQMQERQEQRQWQGVPLSELVGPRP